MSEPPISVLGALAPYLDRQATLKREINTLIARYDPLEVRAVVLELTKQRPGRKALNDFVELRDDIERDVEDWLRGNNPLEQRSNYSIAKRFAERKPGQSFPATMRRIQRKLKKRREGIGLALAIDRSEGSLPYARHLAVCDALAETNSDFWFHGRARGDAARGAMERYRQMIGEPPSEMTIEEVRTLADQTNKNALSRLLQRGLLASALDEEPKAGDDDKIE